MHLLEVLHLPQAVTPELMHLSGARGAVVHQHGSDSASQKQHLSTNREQITIETVFSSSLSSNHSSLKLPHLRQMLI